MQGVKAKRRRLFSRLGWKRDPCWRGILVAVGPAATQAHWSLTRRELEASGRRARFLASTFASTASRMLFVPRVAHIAMVAEICRLRTRSSVDFEWKDRRLLRHSRGMLFWSDGVNVVVPRRRTAGKGEAVCGNVAQRVAKGEKKKKERKSHIISTGLASRFDLPRIIRGSLSNPLTQVAQQDSG